jgi:hypothetical protein
LKSLIVAVLFDMIRYIAENGFCVDSVVSVICKLEEQFNHVQYHHKLAGSYSITCRSIHF